MNNIIEARGKRQEARGKRQEARGKRQEARGKRQAISVALASCNGIKYISEQLDSIRTQTLQPDEVIIADDASSDGTYEFCVDYIARYELTGWKVYQNVPKLGVNKNFRTVMAKCTGDYIFTCDQDDIWMPDKLSSMISVMRQRPEVNLLAANYIPLVNDKPAKVSMKYIELNDGTVIPIRFKDYGVTCLRPGCTFCFRRILLEKFVVMDFNSYLHDGMLWIYAVVSDSLYLLNRQLIFWRRHEKSATGVSFSSYPTIEQRIRGTYETEELYRKLLENSEGLEISSGNIRFMDNMMNFVRQRRNMLSKRSILCAALFVMLNMKYYPTLRNALSDIYAMLFLK